MADNETRCDVYIRELIEKNPGLAHENTSMKISVAVFLKAIRAAYAAGDKSGFEVGKKLSSTLWSIFGSL